MSNNPFSQFRRPEDVEKEAKKKQDRDQFYTNWHELYKLGETYGGVVVKVLGQLRDAVAPGGTVRRNNIDPIYSHFLRTPTPDKTPFVTWTLYKIDGFTRDENNKWIPKEKAFVVINLLRDATGHYLDCQIMDMDYKVVGSQRCSFPVWDTTLVKVLTQLLS